MTRKATGETAALVDWLHDLADDHRARFTVLDQASGYDRAAAAVWHELRPAFADHLDQVRAGGATTVCGAALVAEARRLLERERPALACVVEARHFAHPARSQQDLAAELGITQQAVSRRERQGVELLYQWCHRALATRAGA